MHKIVTFWIRNDISAQIGLCRWHADSISQNGNCDFNLPSLKVRTIKKDEQITWAIIAQFPKNQYYFFFIMVYHYFWHTHKKKKKKKKKKPLEFRLKD